MTAFGRDVAIATGTERTADYNAYTHISGLLATST
jgi:hypothetical protein